MSQIVEQAGAPYEHFRRPHTDGRLRVMIVEDHELVRVGLSTLLSREGDIEVVRVTASGEEALRALGKVLPDVALVDYRLPDMTGAQVCAEMLKVRPRTSVVMLTSYFEDAVLLSCLAAGVRGYITKSGGAPDLADTIRRVARGEAVLAPETVERVLEWARTAKIRNTTLAAIELDILRRVATGQSLRSVAQELRISEELAKSSMRSIKRRLGAADRAHAVALAMKKGLI
jgi:DNA-binding NarL/FixJ family response regulator